MSSVRARNFTNKQTNSVEMSKIEETGSTSTCTLTEYKLFEHELAAQDENDPDRWKNIAKVTGKTVEEVNIHYQRLVDDVELIQSGKVPLPNYKDDRAYEAMMNPIGQTRHNESKYKTRV